jgi:glycosyltransferase involved in cell wall biosynthesis
MYHGNLAAVLARWAGGGRRPPLLWNIRQSLQAIQHEKPMTRGVIRAGARLSSLPRQIVYNAQSSADRHVQIGYRADRTLVIPNGFDTETFRPDPACRAELRQHLGLPPDALIIGLVARWHPVKDHPTFLRAARRISDQMPAAHFVLAGRAVDRENPVLNGLIHELGLESRVHLLGNVADPSGLTAGLDIASCSSLSEAFPNVLGEALACGVPCVSTDVGDAAWIVGDAGVIVPPHDPVRFADACLELLSLDRGAREAMGQRGRDRVRAQFGIDRIATRYAELYTTLVTG